MLPKARRALDLTLGIAVSVVQIYLQPLLFTLRKRRSHVVCSVPVSFIGLKEYQDFYEKPPDLANYEPKSAFRLESDVCLP
jgi:hypothetical protein